MCVFVCEGGAVVAARILNERKMMRVIQSESNVFTVYISNYDGVKNRGRAVSFHTFSLFIFSTPKISLNRNQSSGSTFVHV